MIQLSKAPLHLNDQGIFKILPNRKKPMKMLRFVSDCRRACFSQLSRRPVAQTTFTLNPLTSFGIRGDGKHSTGRFHRHQSSELE